MTHANLTERRGGLFVEGLREGRVGLLVVLCGVCVLCVCVISRGAAWSVWVCGCVSMGGERVVVLVMIRSVDD